MMMMFLVGICVSAMLFDGTTSTIFVNAFQLSGISSTGGLLLLHSQEKKKNNREILLNVLQTTHTKSTTSTRPAVAAFGTALFAAAAGKDNEDSSLDNDHKSSTSRESTPELFFAGSTIPTATTTTGRSSNSTTTTVLLENSADTTTTSKNKAKRNVILDEKDLIDAYNDFQEFLKSKGNDKDNDNDSDGDDSKHRNKKNDDWILNQWNKMMEREEVIDQSTTTATATTPMTSLPTPLTAEHDASIATTLSTSTGIHEGIFMFNKIMVDTIYNIICALYPISTNDDAKKDHPSSLSYIDPRAFVRFYVLETVARIPYFAYLAVLHFRETFGERHEQMNEKMRTHYAEADNEMHHLLIMEEILSSSYNNQKEEEATTATTTTTGATMTSAIQPIDKMFAQTMSFFYFWYVIIVYCWNESAAYHLSELIEAHAYRTYDGFANNFKSELQTLPVPKIAYKYYQQDPSFLFDLVSTVVVAADQVQQGGVDDTTSHRRHRPTLNNLYDVFLTIRDDEGEHWKCLCNLVQYNDMRAVDATHIQSTKPAAKITNNENNDENHD